VCELLQLYTLHPSPLHLHPHPVHPPLSPLHLTPYTFPSPEPAYQLSLGLDREAKDRVGPDSGFEVSGTGFKVDGVGLREKLWI
jgi:hypothetical protein